MKFLFSNATLPGAALALLLLGSACAKKTTPDVPDTLPDLKFQFSVTGAESHDIDFTLVENVATDVYANGAYVAAADLMTINSQKYTEWILAIGANTGGVDPGLYPLNQSGPDVLAFTNVTAGTGYVSVSGSLKIIRSEKYADLPAGLAEDYFLDGEFEATLQDSETPPNVINITGTFEGLNIKK